MARYQVVRWKGIPSLVEAWDGEQAVHRLLSQRFHDLIDAVAMRQGESDNEAYLAGWARDPEAERAGPAEAVADALVTELEAAFPQLVDRYLALP